MDLAHVQERLKNEVACLAHIEDLQRQDAGQLLSTVPTTTRESALDRTFAVAQTAIAILLDAGLDFNAGDPGHGVGHLARDYINAIRLRTLDIDPREHFLGNIAGIFHDSACCLLPRYEEQTQLIRHAEGGAILFDELFAEYDLGLTPAEQMLVQMGIAAHTHYGKPLEVQCADGIVRSVAPFTDTDEDGNPIFAIWLTRWIDRLDINGPTFVGRHYLTQVERHKDFDGEQFYDVRFDDHMRPLNRTRKDIAKDAGDSQTMREHLAMFAGNQNNESVYGRFDFGTMTELRDAQTARLNRIITTTDLDNVPSVSTWDGREEILLGWFAYLTINIEPTELGKDAATKLNDAFHTLPEETQAAWTKGFFQTMYEYLGWAEEVLQDLEDIPRHWLAFAPVGDDIREFIVPDPVWESLFH